MTVEKIISIDKLAGLVNAYNDSLTAYRDNPNDKTKKALENAKTALYNDISNRTYKLYTGVTK